MKKVWCSHIANGFEQRLYLCTSQIYMATFLKDLQAFAIIFRWMCQNHKIWKEIIPKVKSTLRFAAFVFSPLLKWWWITISRLQLLWPSCRPAFAQPTVKLSLKAVVKSCSLSYSHSLNYDMMPWLHKRTIIWGSSYQDRAKMRGFMCALNPLTGTHLRIV